MRRLQHSLFALWGFCPKHGNTFLFLAVLTSVTYKWEDIGTEIDHIMGNFGSRNHRPALVIICSLLPNDVGMIGLS